MIQTDDANLASARAGRSHRMRKRMSSHSARNVPCGKPLHGGCCQLASHALPNRCFREVRDAGGWPTYLIGITGAPEEIRTC